MRSISLVFILLLVPSSITLAQPVLDSLQRDPLAVESTEIGSAAAETIEYWGLTADEWQQQQTLRTRYHGLLSSELTPLEILGIVADDPVERARYARLHAQRQHQILLRIRSYEEEYLAAMRKLTQTAAAKEMQVVVAVECIRGSCVTPLTRALKRAKQGENLHIYVQGASSDEQIRRWATHHAIPIERVRSGQITLNYATPSMKAGLREQ